MQEKKVTNIENVVNNEKAANMQNAVKKSTETN